jgi:aminoglycoside phosphotransferase (APT) family kinase protein
MPVQPDAEIAIGARLVRALLSEQFPALDATTARFIGDGWDNSVWSVEGKWAFRFPRRAVAAGLTARELSVLPMLAPLLPVPIPEPRFVGKPGGGYPWAFFGGPLLAGREAGEADLSDADREALGEELGSFLRALHDLELDADLPADPNRRADMTFRVPRARECLAEVEGAGIWRPPDGVERILEAALRLPQTDARTVLHGDLHVRHVFVERGRHLSAVIDWGDVCVGDPSIDLQLAWSLLPPAGRARFVETYGQIGDERLLRARATAIYFGAMLAAYAHSVDNADLERECLAGLERTLVDWI